MEQGLIVSLLGLLLTFLALGLLILTIVILQKLFGSSEKSATPEVTGTADDNTLDLDEIPVVIATAVTVLRHHERNAARLGQSLERGRGPWWQPPQDPHMTLVSKNTDGRTKV
jgi:Na+-transporting methylmalonyl-CoA/oxaloacetate decarboxylase gamma subunit